MKKFLFTEDSIFTMNSLEEKFDIDIPVEDWQSSDTSQVSGDTDSNFIMSTFVGNVSEGDVLSLTIGPSASGGNGVNTFIQASITATSAVPEPTSLMLLAMSAVAGLVGFRRR